MNKRHGSKPVTVGGMHVGNLKVFPRSSQMKMPTTSLSAFDHGRGRNQEVRQ